MKTSEFLTTRTSQQTVRHASPPPFLRVSGTHRQIGQQIGEACRMQVLHSLESARNLIESVRDELQLDWQGARIQSRKYIPFVQEHYPQYLEELTGISEGANVEFDDLAVLNVMEAVTMDALHLTKCTSMAVNEERTVDGHVLIAHNEDWVPEDEVDVFVVQVTPDKEPPFIAMTYGGLLPNIGFNAYGAGSLGTAQKGRVWLRAAIAEKVVHVEEIHEQQERRAARRQSGYGLWGSRR